MVIINGTIRHTSEGHHHVYQGIKTINSRKITPNKCIWQCHFNTTYCKKEHVNVGGRLKNIIDPFYFGIIRLLNATGNYTVANIIFLVFLIPLFIYYFIICSIDMQIQTRKLKKHD